MTIQSPLVQNIIPGLAERGKIKIGMKGELKKSSAGKEFQLPKKLDHFIITSLERDKEGNFLRDEEVYKKLKLADKPKRLPVTFVYDDIALNLQSRLACYAGRKLWCSGDGKTAFRRSKNPEDKTWVQPFECPCPCERAESSYQGDKCKLNATLSLCFQDFDVFGGVYKFRTTGMNSYRSLWGTMIQARYATGGRLAGIPFELVIAPKSATIPETGSVTTVYVVALEFKGDVKKLRDETRKLLLEDKEYFGRLRELEEEARQYVTAEVPETEDAEIVEEFYPEQAAKAEGVEITQEEKTPVLADPNEAPKGMHGTREPVAVIPDDDII